jgi:hypothetical protein
MKRESDPNIIDPPEWRRPRKRLWRIMQSLWNIADSEIENWTAHWSSLPLDVQTEQ